MPHPVLPQIGHTPLPYFPKHTLVELLHRMKVSKRSGIREVSQKVHDSYVNHESCAIHLSPRAEGRQKVFD